MIVVGIDPGLDGAIVGLEEREASGNLQLFSFHPMPVKEYGKSREINFDGFRTVLTYYPTAHFFLERAMPIAMGSKHAFNYGRGFAALEIALHLQRVPVTYVEPTKWSKVMHDGISSDLKPKAKSMIAVERLFPALVPSIPRSRTGKLHDGIVEALLIAGYGLRQMTGTSQKTSGS